MFGLFKKRQKTGVSKGGSTMYEYKTTDKVIGTESLAGGNEIHLEAISAHIEKHIGKVDFVFHELISALVHIDVHIVYPTPARNFYTLVTSGMSDRPMNIPSPEVKDWEYGEVMLCLPPEWKIDEESLKDEKNYWPIRMLKFIARFPHEYNSWVSFGHTIPNGNPPNPLADNVGFCGVLLDVPVTTGKEFPLLQLEDKRILFYALIPLFEDEMNFKLQEGNDALLELFDQHNVTELVNVNRRSVVGQSTGRRR